jgi:predicted O-methyltransferase YrrM
MGVEQCSRRGFLPVATHYYQPIFDGRSMDPRIWTQPQLLYGIDWREADQIALLHQLGAAFGSECFWPAHAHADDDQYFWDNGSFGFTSACLLHGMIRLLRPQRVLEIGGGYSTLVSSQALAMNKDRGAEGSLVSIDPYPRPILKAADRRGACSLVAERVETLDPELFLSLDAGDLLFIDSSHVVRPGNDVAFLYFNILPRLRPGVVVHIHDIHLPYEYPAIYSMAMDRPRRFWNEQYILRALLIGNASLEVLLSGYWMAKEHSQAFRMAFAAFDPKAHRESSSLYLRVK